MPPADIWPGAIKDTMKFKYNGDNKILGPVYGYDFSYHKIVDIPEEDTFTIGKLLGNPQFDFVKTAKRQVKKHVKNNR